MECHKIDFNNLLITTNENLFFKIDVRALMLKCLFELNSFESALSHLQTFRIFLKNSKIIKESSGEKHMMFLNVVNEMIRLKFNFDGFKLMNLRKKAMASKDLPASDWVMQKMDSLNK